MAANISGKHASFTRGTIFISKMETASSSETLVASYQTLRSHNSEIHNSKVKQILKFCFLRKILLLVRFVTSLWKTRRNVASGWWGCTYFHPLDYMVGGQLQVSAALPMLFIDTGGFCGISYTEKYYFLYCLSVGA